MDCTDYAEKEMDYTNYTKKNSLNLATEYHSGYQRHYQTRLPSGTSDSSASTALGTGYSMFCALSLEEI